MGQSRRKTRLRQGTAASAPRPGAPSPEEPSPRTPCGRREEKKHLGKQQLLTDFNRPAPRLATEGAERGPSCLLLARGRAQEAGRREERPAPTSGAHPAQTAGRLLLAAFPSSERRTRPARSRGRPIHSGYRIPRLREPMGSSSPPPPPLLLLLFLKRAPGLPTALASTAPGGQPETAPASSSPLPRLKPVASVVLSSDGSDLYLKRDIGSRGAGVAAAAVSLRGLRALP